MKIVTSYNYPDLDGTSCMFAYSELLNRLGEEANYYVWGEPKQEVLIVCDIFGIDLKGIKIEDIQEDSEFVVVDLNGTEQLHEIIKYDKIVEVIDHHSLSRWLQQYTNIQRLQIDRIGSVATIITERYKENNLIPSRESAILLFYGIISNSVNLKANITNKRDINACNWLKSVCKDISEEKIEEIFVKKSIIEDKNLRQEMECELPYICPEFKCIVGQIEIANLKEFLKTRKSKMIDIMKTVKQEKKLDYIFVNCVDILNGYIIIFGADEESNNFIERTFNYKFNENREVEINKIIQRKELTKALKNKKYCGTV